MVADHDLEAEPFGDRALDQIEFGPCVRAEAIDRDHDRNAELVDVRDMSREVGHAGLERAEILHPERVLGDAAVHFERAHRRHDDGGGGFEPGLAALDVEEFLRAEIGAEPRLGDDIVGELERGFGRHDRIAAVRDIGERAAMDQRRRAFERLDEIGLDRLLEQGRHGALRLQLGRRHRRLRRR